MIGSDRSANLVGIVVVAVMLLHSIYIIEKTNYVGTLRRKIDKKRFLNSKLKTLNFNIFTNEKNK